MSKSDGNFLTLTDAVAKFSADGMRLCLADSGDSIDDANFVESMADAGILRLYNLIEWTKEILSGDVPFRKDGTKTFNDGVFESEINLKIKETGDYYSKMLFKEALRTGFFEFQAAKDKYIVLSATEKPKLSLLKRYIEVQALVLSPICPHVAEYIWKLLGKKTSIVEARWPTVGEIDEISIKASQYLMDAAHSFRIYLKNHLTVKKPKEQAPKEKPNVGIVYVAKQYPQWQSIVLTTMKEMYLGNKNVLPENKLISAKLSSLPELKKYMKRVMPFVQAIREKLEKTNISALNLTSEFDEFQLFCDHKEYITNTLDLEELEVKYSDEATDKTKDECCPGTPYINFSVKPSVLVNCVNQQLCNGFFTIPLRISQGTTVDSVKKFIARDVSQNASSIKLHRYVDPNSGPRVIPNCDDKFKGAVEIKNTSTFSVDIAKGTVQIQDGKENYPLGLQIIYEVKV